MTSLIRPEVRKTKGYRLSRPAHRIKLNQNESPYDLPEPLKERILARLREIPWNRYPTPFAESLTEKIARYEGWDPAGVLVAGGSNILIQAVMLATAVGKKILTVRPGFSLYEIEGKLLGNRVVEVPLNASDFSLPLDRFLRESRRLKPAAVFLANPNAPTGNLFPEEALLEIIRKAPGIVVIDEAYHQFAGTTLRPFLKKFKNFVLLRTLSKAFSLGGVRLGYLLGDSKLVAEVRKVVLPFSVGALSEAVGETVIDEPSYVAERVREIVRERDCLCAAMSRIPALRVTPSATNFIFFQTKGAKPLFEKLLQAGILIRNVTAPSLPNALRVTVGSPEENQGFLAAIRDICSVS